MSQIIVYTKYTCYREPRSRLSKSRNARFIPGNLVRIKWISAGLTIVSHDRITRDVHLMLQFNATATLLALAERGVNIETVSSVFDGVNRESFFFELDGAFSNEN